MADNDDIDPTVDLDPHSGNQSGEPASDTDDAAEIPSDDAGDDGGGEEPAPELIDWDLGDGKKVKVPAVVKDALLRQQDYTRKTQEVAEQRRALEADRASMTAARQADRALQVKVGQLIGIEEQLARFAPNGNGGHISVDQIDWVTWQRTNPQQAEQALKRVQALQQTRSALQKAVEEGQKKHEAETQQETAKRFLATRAFAEKEIPNWAEREKAIGDYVGKLGLSDRARRALETGMEPSLLRLLDDALDGRRYREARANKSRADKAAQAPAPLKTVAQQRSGGSPSPNDRQSIDDWMKARNRQLAKTG